MYVKPLLVWSATFPAGPPRELAHSVSSDTGVQFEVVTEGSSSSKKRKVSVKATWSGGSCVGRLSDAGVPTKYLVGVFHKDSNKLDLFDTKPVVQLRYEVDDGGVAEAMTTQDPATAISWGERKRALVETFGSKRKQRAQAAQDANRIGADTISAARVFSKQLVSDTKRVADEGGFVDTAAAGSWLRGYPHCTVCKRVCCSQSLRRKWRRVKRCFPG
jgi:hypothetical protein